MLNVFTRIEGTQTGAAEKHDTDWVDGLILMEHLRAPMGGYQADNQVAFVCKSDSGGATCKLREQFGDLQIETALPVNTYIVKRVFAQAKYSFEVTGLADANAAALVGMWT